MENNERDFKGVWIPKEVWLDTRLSMIEKGILVEIDSLDFSESGCFASNESQINFRKANRLQREKENPLRAN